MPVVVANPNFAWDGLGWHLDLERIQVLFEKKLALRELHRIEVEWRLQPL